MGSSFAGGVHAYVQLCFVFMQRSPPCILFSRTAMLTASFLKVASCTAAFLRLRIPTATSRIRGWWTICGAGRAGVWAGVLWGRPALEVASAAGSRAYDWGLLIPSGHDPRASCGHGPALARAGSPQLSPNGKESEF